MSAEKRPAEDDAGSSRMLVKRQNMSSSDGAVARLNASVNALVQAVSRNLGAHAQAPDHSCRVPERADCRRRSWS